MKLEITSETVAEAVYIIWKVAMTSNTHTGWLERWATVDKQLDGLWNLVNWAAQYQEREEAMILMQDIIFLKSIANENRFNWREK